MKKYLFFIIIIIIMSISYLCLAADVVSKVTDTDIKIVSTTEQVVSISQIITAKKNLETQLSEFDTQHTNLEQTYNERRKILVNGIASCVQIIKDAEAVGIKVDE